MKLSKAQFCKYIEEYKKMSEQNEMITDTLEISSEWTPMNWIDSYYEMLSDLCELPEDKNTGTLLDWFIFDTHYGKENNVILGNGRRWVINSPEVLYDFIKED